MIIGKGGCIVDNVAFGVLFGGNGNDETNLQGVGRGTFLSYFP